MYVCLNLYCVDSRFITLTYCITNTIYYSLQTS